MSFWSCIVLRGPTCSSSQQKPTALSGYTDPFPDTYTKSERGYQSLDTVVRLIGILIEGDLVAPTPGYPGTVT
eukprot:9983-Rhodomonas_salina.1